MTANVGIVGLYLYFPPYVVSQADLEQADGVPGKYTQGLGQGELGFCGDREDVISMAATAMLRLMEAYDVSPADIGMLEVGTETGVDRSKSVASYLMHYLNQGGNFSAQGVDNVHACYGGTAALLHAADWVAGPSWDGRLALVVGTDIAIYEEGSPARATGGAGAVAMLVGPNAPLAIEPQPWRASFSAHSFDFFKPESNFMYPVVDGPATLYWYTRAADACGSALLGALYQGAAPTALGAVAAPQAAGAGQGGEGGRVGGGAAAAGLGDEGRRRRSAEQEQEVELWRMGMAPRPSSGADLGSLQLGGSDTQVPQLLPPATQVPPDHQHQHQQQQQQQQQHDSGSKPVHHHHRHHHHEAPKAGGLLPWFSFYLSHAPFNKLVRKTFARLALLDALYQRRTASLAEPRLASGGGSAAGGPALEGSSDGPAAGTAAATAAAGAQVAAKTTSSVEEALSAEPGAAAGHAMSPAAAALLAALPASAEAAALDPRRLPDSSMSDKALERAVLAATHELYTRMAAPGAAVQRRLGNLYTASLYSGLAGLLEAHRPRQRRASGPSLREDSVDGTPSASASPGQEADAWPSCSLGALGMLGRRILMFSFGSGVEASLFTLRCHNGAGKFTLEALVSKQDITRRLDARTRRGPGDFANAMAAMAAGHRAAPFEPRYPVADLEEGAVYLERVDGMHHRHYARKLRRSL